MYIPERVPLLATYEVQVEAAYRELLEAYIELLETGEGDWRSLIGRCGAQVSAAHKRCKRSLVFAVLERARDGGLDITTTVAENLCLRLIGRGVDLRAALIAFGTPGRTAATKSPVVAADLAELEAELEPEVRSLIDTMAGIRKRHKAEYSAWAEAARGKA